MEGKLAADLLEKSRREPRVTISAKFLNILMCTTVEKYDGSHRSEAGVIASRNESLEWEKQ